MNEAKLEAMARALCIKRRQDPEAMVSGRRMYDDLITNGRSEPQQARWMLARQEIIRVNEILQIMSDHCVIWVTTNKDQLP